MLESGTLTKLGANPQCYNYKSTEIVIIPNKTNTLDVGNNLEFTEIIDRCPVTTV